MANEMDGGEFWLPSDFLTDDFNETESDEDESVTGLITTHQMNTHSLKTYSSALKGESPKPSEMATSPQSTLYGIGSSSFSSDGGSPDGPSQVSSPPSTPFRQPRDDALDLLYAAAGEVERLGLNNESSRGLLVPPQACSYQIPVAKNQKNGTGCFYSSRDLIQQQLQAARFYQLKKQQLLKLQQQQQQYSAAAAAADCRRNQNRATNSVRPLSTSAWPPLQSQPQQQQQTPLPGSGMTAVFLNGGSRRQSNGTGVFLPRRVGTTSEPKKKPGCSTVLLPARVVQALNLNLDDMGLHPRFPGCYVLDNDAAIARSNMKRNQAAAAPAAATSPELRLPQEWTY